MELFFKRLSKSLLTIWFTVTLIFIASRLTPGDPVVQLLGDNASEEEIAFYRQELGLDLPILSQYTKYLTGLVSGSLGTSLFTKEDVFKSIIDAAGPTITLALVTMFIASLLGVLCGLWAALNHGNLIDVIIRILNVCFLAVPVFSLAPLLVYLFSIKLKLLPVSEWGTLKHSILPSMTLVFPLMSILSRVTRNNFLEMKNAQWVSYLNAKGLKKSQINWRIIKAIFPSILNVIGIQLSVLLAGTMITEMIFSIPGMGQLLLESIQNRDYPVIQGVVFYTTLLYLCVYFFVDYFVVKLDPRSE